MGQFDKRYLLRVWRSGQESQTHQQNLLASLRDVDDGKIRTFDGLEALVTYLVLTAGNGGERA